MSRCNIDETGALLWNGSKVLTKDKMEEILGLVHYKRDKHVRDVRFLRKTLSDKGYVLPSFLGGLQRAFQQ